MGNLGTILTSEATSTNLSIDIVTGEGIVRIDGKEATMPFSEYYLAGSLVELKAFPAKGWQFKEWSGDVNGKDTTFVITMDDNKSITAVFEDDDTTPTLNDVPTVHPFFAEIKAVAGAGISTGWEGHDGIFTFRPTENVIRMAMAVLFYRSLEL